MARSLWTGSVSFGLVNVPVRMFKAVRQKDVSFRQIDKKTGKRVHYKRVAGSSDKEVDYDDIVKGYEISKDEYVTLEPEELEALEPERTHMIAIEDFVELAEIDPIYYDSSYYLAPDRTGAKAYRLLYETMRTSGKVAIGRFVLRTKEHVAAIRPYDGALVLETMVFGDEVVPASSIEEIPGEEVEVSKRELDVALSLVESMTASFDPARYRDEYRERVEELVEQKAKGGTIEIPEAAPERPKVVDLLEALRASVEEQSSDEQRAERRRRGAARSRGARGEDVSLEELQEMAREKKVKGRSKMNKEELRKAVGLD